MDEKYFCFVLLSDNNGYYAHKKALFVISNTQVLTQLYCKCIKPTMNWKIKIRLKIMVKKSILW